MSEPTREAVTFWYDDHGVGDPLVSLHGGFSDSRETTSTSTVRPACAEC